MFEEIGIPVITIIFNFIGGCIRYLFVNPINLLFNKRRFTFNECLYGLKTRKGKMKKSDHFVANSIIGAVFFILFSGVIIKYSL